MYTVSLDSGTPAQIAAVKAEMERTLGYANDPLVILIAIEEYTLYIRSGLNRKTLERKLP